MIKSERVGSVLTVFLQGEIDHCSAIPIREIIEKMLKQRKTSHLIVDFSQVSFMDSSGVGMLIGRYKTMTDLGGKVSARGLHPPVDRLFRLAGLHRILAVEDNEEREEYSR